MARLPDTIDRNIPTSPRGVVSIRPNLQLGLGAVSNALDDASRIAFHVQEQRRAAQADFDTANAETEMLKSHMALTDALSGDNYADYVPTYQKGMEQAKANALKLIRDPEAKMRFVQRADTMILRGSDGAHNLAMKKEGDLGIATTIRNTDDLTRLGVGARDEATRIQSLNLIRDSWESAYRNGWVDRVQADDAQKKAATNYMTDVFEAMPPAARIAALTGKQPEVDMSNQYNTKLTLDEEAKFQEWLKTLSPKQRSSYDYDLRGAFKAGVQPAANGHFPDTFKKPNHPTFSDQSQYANAPGALAGSWAADNETYIPNPARGGLASQLPLDLKNQLLERAQSQLVAQQNAAEKARKDAIEKGIVEAKNAIMQDPTRGLAAVDHNLMLQLDPNQVLNLKHFANEMSMGQEVKTDPTYLDNQMSLAASDPQSFLDQWDMSANIAHLSSADVEKLINVKAGVLKDDPATKLKLSSAVSASTIIGDTLNAMPGLQASEKGPDAEARRNVFKQRAAQAVYNLQQQLGRENLSPDEIHSVIDPLAIEHANKWYQFGHKFAFEDTAPAADAAATTKPAEAKAQPPAARSVPGMTIDQVPQDIRRQIQDARSRHGLGTSDEEVVADYQTYLQKQQR